MLKSKYFIFICFLLLTLTGCTHKDVYNYNYIFEGEGLYWQGKIKFDGTHIFYEKNEKFEFEGNDSQEMVLEYKDKVN